MSYFVSFCSCVWNFSPFSIAITSLEEERANLSAFRTFVRFVLVCICRFPLPLGVWEGLRFVIVALPGLFSYLFFSFMPNGFFCLWSGLFIICSSSILPLVPREGYPSWLWHFLDILTYIFMMLDIHGLKSLTFISSIQASISLSNVIPARDIHCWTVFELCSAFVHSCLASVRVMPLGVGKSVITGLHTTNRRCRKIKTS